MHREAQFDRPLAPPAPPWGTGLLAVAVAGLVVLDVVPWGGSADLFGFRPATIAAVLGGTHALARSLGRLAEGRVGADLAIAIAAIAAILIGEPLVAAEVVAIGLIGELLEEWTVRRAGRSLAALPGLFPERCWVVREGVEVRTFTRDLLVSDVVVVKAGGKLPGDGTVTAGAGALNTQSLTGESLPRRVGVGNSVLAGSVLPEGTLTIRLTRVGPETTAGQVIAFTEQALKTPGESERQADRLARWFLPVVLGVALVTFAVATALYAAESDRLTGRYASAMRQAAYPALAVLVVACPCPLVLATPAAVAAALGRLAGTGVLVKGGAALERLAQVSAVAVDKTGTLTTGELAVEPATPDDLLAVAATAAVVSEHPASLAVVAEARRRGLSVPATGAGEVVPGLGVRATVGDTEVLVGSLRFLRQSGVAVPDPVDIPPDAGHVAVASGGTFRGVIVVRDTARPEAAGVLAELSALGLPVTLLTGDRTPHAVAHLPFAATHAELLPLEKAERLPANALYVGDGLNDAPALARAAVSAAVGHGPAVVGAAADLVFLGEPLRELPMVVRLARAVVATIRQNVIVFGFGVNALGVLLTAWLWPVLAPDAVWAERGPVAAAVFHQVGSLLVIVNSMRLLRFERPAPGWSRGLTARYDRVRQWSWDETLHELIHRRGEVTLAVAAVTLVGYANSQWLAVAAGEAVLVERLGQAECVLGPGLHWRWPAPVETCTRFRPDAPHLIEVGYRTAAEGDRALFAEAMREQARLSDAPEAGLDWESRHAGRFERLPEESTYVTGDGNVVELLATVEVTIHDPIAYFLTGRDPDAQVRRATEGVLQELVGRAAFTPLLSAGRGPLATAATAELPRRLPVSLGITVRRVTVADLHPPQEVAGPFHAVAAAMQERDRRVNLARTEALSRVAAANVEALERVQRSQSEADRLVRTADAEADRFRRRAARPGQPPDGTLRDLLATRLTLEAVARSLAGRAKVFVDAAELTGTRKLYFLGDGLTPPPAVNPGSP